MNDNVSLTCLEMHIFINKLVDCVILKLHYNSNILSHIVRFTMGLCLWLLISLLRCLVITQLVISLFLFVLNISLFVCF